MSLVLGNYERSRPRRLSVSIESYLALPWCIPSLPSALVERDQEVCAAISVGEWEAGIPHLLTGRLCVKLAIEVAKMGGSAR